MNFIGRPLLRSFRPLDNVDVSQRKDEILDFLRNNRCHLAFNNPSELGDALLYSNLFSRLELFRGFLEAINPITNTDRYCDNGLVLGIIGR
jgi:hypothetical protein